MKKLSEQVTELTARHASAIDLGKIKREYDAAIADMQARINDLQAQNEALLQKCEGMAVSLHLSVSRWLARMFLLLACLR